jgi:hypothetical protein
MTLLNTNQRRGRLAGELKRMEKTEDRERHPTHRLSIRSLLKPKPGKNEETQPPSAEPPTPNPDQVADTLILLLKNLLTKGEAGKQEETAKPPAQLPEVTPLEEILQATQPTPPKKRVTKKEIQSFLDLLDQKLAQGELTERTYLKVRSRWEKKLRKKKASRTKTTKKRKRSRRPAQKKKNI